MKLKMHPADVICLGIIAVLGVLTLLALTGCKTLTPPPPVGAISGRVTVDGNGITGMEMCLRDHYHQTCRTTTTSVGGGYRYDDVEGGHYSVELDRYYLGWAAWDSTMEPATISTAGQKLVIDFTGQCVRNPLVKEQDC